MSVKILVVDDAATDRLMIKNMLSEYDILTASDGKEAIRLINADPDIILVILDLNMPVMDGFQVLEYLRANVRYKDLRVIILTNYNELENEIRGLNLGAVDYIRKPVQFKSLQVRIQIHMKLLEIQRLLEQKLYERSLTFDAIFQQSPIGIAISHNSEPFEPGIMNPAIMNPAFEKITGRTREELVRLGWAKITHPDDLEEDMINFGKLRSGEIKSYTIEKRYIKPDGSYVWVHMVVAPLDLINEHKYNHICLAEDITERKAIEKILLENEKSKSVLMDNLPGVMYRCDLEPDRPIRFISSGCLELTGYGPEHFLNDGERAFVNMIVPKYREYLKNEWEDAVKTHRKFKEEYEIVTASGEIKWVWDQGQAIYDDNGNVVCLEGLIIDITNRKSNEIKLKYLSEHDALTGLSNLKCFEDVFYCQREKPKKAKGAVILINVRKFSVINRIFGYRFGNQLIRNISNCLLHIACEDCKLFQISVDRFLFFISSSPGKTDLAVLCERIIKALEAEIEQRIVSFNIGVLEIEDYAACDTEDLLKRVFAAAEHVNDHYRFGYCFFDSEMEQKQQRESAVRQALAEVVGKPNDPSLFMQYQPIYDLKSNTIIGYEALARFHNQTLGWVSPIEFIPIAEASQLMLPLGKKLMRLVFDAAVRIYRKGYRFITFAFNVSPIQLLSDSFLPDLESTVRETGIEPRNLVLEITESVFSDNYQEINDKLERIKSMGMRVAIDDFGTGYSSLAREEELNINCLKIDKYFIDKLMDIPSDNALVGDIISMAHKLGHCVVAEGVEFEKQMNYLAEHGCDMVQGYLFSKPVSEDSALELLKNSYHLN